MISYIKGIVTHLDEDFLILECNDIGYKIYMAKSSLYKINKNENKIKIYTYMSVKEDGITLFGFLDKEEADVFNKLITVSGVGPKGALSFLSSLSPKDIINAVLTEDIKTLSSPKGIGKKMAEKVVFILKDKFKDTVICTESNDSSFNSNSVITETCEALISLGYTRSEALNAINSSYKNGIKTEELLKISLKYMSII